MAFPAEPTRFASAPAFRRWLERHHGTARELLLELQKTGSATKGLTYAAALDEALCLGWIDGVRKRVDDQHYTIRFTPRKPGSIWSKINVRHVTRLTQAGKMQPAGLMAFARRKANKTGIYSFENPPAEFPPGYAEKFQANAEAWKFFNAQAPWYRRLATHKVSSPKQESTRLRWLDRLVTASAAGKRV